MSNENVLKGFDPDYLTRRAAQERAAAERASDTAARRAHEMLAERYAERLNMAMPPTS